ncbi:MAG: hypothetical protein ABIC04_06930 [Nanoarchaeota archaeon]
MDKDLKNKVIQYIKKDKRVCPKPDKWNELWEILPDKVKGGNGWNPPLPLILAAWWDTTDNQKRERLLIHINYAFEKGVLDRIWEHLNSLTEKDWVHDGEI